MSPRCTLANTKLPPKTDNETTPTNSFVHNANACQRLSQDCAPEFQRLVIILALLLIVLAFLAMA